MTIAATSTDVPRARRLRLPIALAIALATVALGLTGCLGTPGDTSQVVLLESRTVNGWQFDQYRNLAYPCSISGYQTFVIGRKVGSSDTATKPLWVKMRGGGAGWFDANGNPQPSAAVKSEDSFDKTLSYNDNGLMAQVRSAPEGFRLLLVSMCSHDVYSGNNTPDPHNPNTTPDGQPRPTTGLIATKAAIQYTMDHYPTDDFFLHGTSAGGAGTFSVAYAMQIQGLAPAGIISDSGVINQEWEIYVAQNGVSGSVGCDKATDDRTSGVIDRVDPALADINNEPDRLVARGALTVPVLHIWNRNDQNSCGDVQIPCPMHDGTTETMGASECRHTPLRRVIQAQGPTSKSEDLEVCVEGGDDTVPCDRHVVTAGANLTNVDTSLGAPADYRSAIMAWVRQRLADD